MSKRAIVTYAQRILDTPILTVDDLPPVNQWEADICRAVAKKMSAKEVRPTDYRRIALMLSDLYTEEFERRKRMTKDICTAMYCTSD